MGLRSERMNHLVTRVGAATAVALALLAIGGVASRVDAGSPQGSSSPSRDQAGTAKAKGGSAPSKPLKLYKVLSMPAGVSLKVVP